MIIEERVFSNPEGTQIYVNAICSEDCDKYLKYRGSPSSIKFLLNRSDFKLPLVVENTGFCTMKESGSVFQALVDEGYIYLGVL